MDRILLSLNCFIATGIPVELSFPQKTCPNFPPPRLTFEMENLSLEQVTEANIDARLLS